MRLLPSTLTLVLAAALPVSLTASVEASTAPSRGAAPTAAAAGQPTSARAVVDIKTYSGRWVVPSVEGAVVTVRRRSVAALSTSWRMRPVTPGSSTYTIATVATTDGKPACLTAVGESVALRDCTTGTRDQRFRVGRGDFEGQVTFTGRRGTLNTDPDGSLRLGDMDEPSAVFTVRRARRAR